MRALVAVGMTLGGAVGALAAAPLPALGTDGAAVTVSGISSGGYMAVQFQVAFSQLVKGAGVLAAGPYDCAENSVLKALTRCMAPNRLAPPPTVSESVARVEAHARAGQIDAPAGLADDRVWVLSGGGDRTVERPVVDALVAFYRHWLPATSVAYVRLDDAAQGLNAGHGMISVSDAHPNACAASEPPYINRCGNFDAPGELLRFLLGPLQARGVATAGRLAVFDQRAFVDGLAADAGLAEEGLVYVPDTCRAGGCRVHVAFHGCRQNLEQIGRRFAEGSGYDEWAATNRLVVLYPQTVTRNGWAWGSWRWVVNPKGCWDWWGYAGPDYATRSGPQMAAVRRMIARLAEAPAGR